MELPLSVLLILLEDADNMVLDMEATGSGIERDEHGRDMEAWDFKLQEGKSYMMHGVGPEHRLGTGMTPWAAMAEGLQVCAICKALGLTR